MSMQPLSNTSPASEPPAQRRRAAEPEAGRESEPFTLPDARAEQAAAAAVAPAEAAAVSAETRHEPVAKPEDTPKPNETVPAPPANAAKPDVGAQVTIAAAAAAAAVAGIEAEVSGNTATTVKAEAASKTEAGKAKTETEKTEAEKAEAGKSETGKSGTSRSETGKIGAGNAEMGTSEAGKAGTSDKAEMSAETEKAASEAKASEGEAAPVVVVTPQVPAELVAIAALPLIGVNLAPVLDPAAKATTAPSGAAAVIGAGSAKPTTPQNPATQPAQTALVAAQLAASTGPEAKAPAGPDKGDPAQPAITGGQASATIAATEGLASFAQIAGPASALAEFKPLEAALQVQSPIDASALAQQAAAKAEPLRLLAALEQPAAATSTGVNGRGTSDGQPTPLHVLPIEIGLKALSGARQFDIRLDPGELGRVDVNLSISDDGEVSARLVVDRVETLHLLQRDARTLERAFEQAGLKPSDAGVDITLRDPSDQSGFRQNRQQDEAAQRSRAAAGATTSDDTIVPAEPAPIRRLVRLGGVDLSI
ncbi:flagellar hook-length control protein FliK [Bosea lathyri]|uniref:Flagellar hook-length control protein FliK n=1 Tax=Bosea lathyri TaxID=1036778 RepID=A0A1H6BDN2_9HYPH|nr:flagellar hook-length control protein FliK [Bosea lathyri]SEG58772.1 Flagellar hook-length control protein FliK [Bosea lathyri]